YFSQRRAAQATSPARSCRSSGAIPGAEVSLRRANDCRSTPSMSRRSVIATNDNAQVVGTLSALRTAENECRRCPLYKNATRAVPGEGPRRASLMLVGEQPGDKEDLAGLPFVGPAGRILDRALADARIDRK